MIENKRGCVINVEKELQLEGREEGKPLGMKALWSAARN